MPPDILRSSEDDALVSLPPYTITSRITQLVDHSVYLSGEIEEPQLYVGLISALREAGETDSFTFYLNTTGGYLHTGLQLLNAIQDTKAHVRMVVDPIAYSMGSLLFLAGDEMSAPPYATLMFHNYSSELMGKGNEQLARVHAAVDNYGAVLRGVCRYFLSEAEIRSVLDGKDLWLDADQITRRLARMTKARQSAKHGASGGKSSGAAIDV